MSISEKESDQIRKDIYDEYCELASDDSCDYPVEAIQMLYESFSILCENDYELFLKKMGVLIYDFYTKSKAESIDDPYLKKMESIDDLEKFAEIMMEDYFVFFVIVDYLINDYKYYDGDCNFSSLMKVDPELGINIARTYHPNSEALIDEYKKEMNEVKKMNEFMELYTPDLASIYISYQKFVPYFNVKLTTTLLQMKLDTYQGQYPMEYETIFYKLFQFCYSYQEEQKRIGNKLTKYDSMVETLYKKTEITELFSIINNDENMPLVEYMIELFLKNYRGQDTFEYKLPLEDYDSDYNLNPNTVNWFNYTRRYISSFKDNDSATITNKLIMDAASLKNGTFVRKVIQVMAIEYYNNYSTNLSNPLIKAINQCDKEGFTEFIIDNPNWLEILVENELVAIDFNEESSSILIKKELKTKRCLNVYRTFYPDLSGFLEEYVSQKWWTIKKERYTQLMKEPVSNFVEFLLFLTAFKNLGASDEECVRSASNKLEQVPEDKQDELIESLATVYYVLYKNKTMKEANSTAKLKRDNEMIASLEDMKGADIIPFIKYNLEARNIIVEGIIKEFDVIHYSKCQQNVQSFQKKFVRKFRNQ